MPAPLPSDLPASDDTAIIVARPRLARVVCAVGRTVRSHGKAIQAEGCPERFEFAFYRWIWNSTRDSQPRIDAAHQWQGHLRVIELCQWTRRSMDEFLETI